MLLIEKLTTENSQVFHREYKRETPGRTAMYILFCGILKCKYFKKINYQEQREYFTKNRKSNSCFLCVSSFVTSVVILF